MTTRHILSVNIVKWRATAPKTARQKLRRCDLERVLGGDTGVQKNIFE